MSKIVMKESFGRKHTFFDVKSLIDHAVTPDAYSYSGDLENMRAKTNRIAEVLGSLIQNLYDKDKLTLEEISEISGVYSDLSEIPD